MIGRLADHYGKLPVYRVVATISIALMLAGDQPAARPVGGRDGRGGYVHAQ